jgi:RNA polymerase sigma-70 factor (ECF subfamily)
MTDAPEGARAFEDRLLTARPRLHRYCARMTGSVFDGEDLAQDAVMKALQARAAGLVIDNLEGWLLRVATNACRDAWRRDARVRFAPIEDDMQELADPAPDVGALDMRVFLRLPELQRCAVILKDVLGHSVDDVAEIAGCTSAAAKSALQRGRAALKHLADEREECPVPKATQAKRDKMTTYARLFREGDLDAIRAMLADDVKLDLVNRLKLQGRDEVELYFTRYAQEPKWRFEAGMVEGRPAMLVFDATNLDGDPAHFVVIDWREGQIAAIRDFLFAPYVLMEADWRRAS